MRQLMYFPIKHAVKHAWNVGRLLLRLEPLATEDTQHLCIGQVDQHSVSRHTVPCLAPLTAARGAIGGAQEGSFARDKICSI